MIVIATLKGKMFQSDGPYLYLRYRYARCRCSHHPFSWKEAIVQENRPHRLPVAGEKLPVQENPESQQINSAIDREVQKFPFCFIRTTPDSVFPSL
jgi:hypothetical protein